MSSRRGVYLLVRQGDRFREMVTGRIFTEDQLLANLAATEGRPQRGRARRAVDAPIVAEELVIGENGVDQIPFDYKMYTFDGSVEFIVQVDRNGPRPRLAFFNGDFLPLEPHKIDYLSKQAMRGEHRRPANWQALLDAARRVSQYIDKPFVSLDTYTTGDEVIFGELTHSPGGPYYGMWRFSDELDAKLGSLCWNGFQKRGWPIPEVIGLPPVLEPFSMRIRKKVVNDLRALVRQIRRPNQSTVQRR